jgi:hypothetical protein
MSGQTPHPAHQHAAIKVDKKPLYGRKQAEKRHEENLIGLKWSLS